MTERRRYHYLSPIPETAEAWAWITFPNSDQPIIKDVAKIVDGVNLSDIKYSGEKLATNTITGYTILERLKLKLKPKRVPEGKFIAKVIFRPPSVANEYWKEVNRRRDIPTPNDR